MIEKIKRSFSFAKEIVLRPKTTTIVEAPLKDLVVYLSIISLIPAAILTLISFVFPILMPLLVMAPLLFPLFIVFTIISFLLLAGIVHFSGKIFRVFKKGYTHTFAGLVYGSTPIIFLSWILLLSFLFMAISFLLALGVMVMIGLVLAIWSFSLQISALANQQSISKKKAFGILLFTGIIVTIFIFIPFGLKPKPPSATPGTFLFMDDYEDNPEITKTSHELWMQIIEDTKEGNYWADQEHWLENAKSVGKKYAIDHEMGDATITTDVTHSGTRSVEITVSKVPPEWYYVSSLLARYFRDQSLYRDGVYEVGVWFYVPEGNVPSIVFGMENHPSWLKQSFAYAGINTEDGSVYATDDNERITIGNVDFQYNTWFKMWIVWDIRTEEFTLHYKSPTEEKTFEVDWVWVSGCNWAYWGYKAFNFYAGGVNLQTENKQRFYVDDFYAKVVG